MISIAVKDWLQLQLKEDIKTVTPLSGGKNNQTLLITTLSQKYVLKIYFRDKANRFHHETEFVNLLQRFNVSGIPRLLAKDASHGVALYEYIPGGIPEKAEPAMVQKTAQWLAAINGSDIRNGATLMPKATGGLFDVAAFFEDVYQRKQSIMTVTPKDDIDQACVRLLSSEMMEVLELLNLQRRSLAADQWQLERCLSPSDIGFHNTLVLTDRIKPVSHGRARHAPGSSSFEQSTASSDQLFFLDFEYAGWDSAVKLICDFFAQPRFSIDPNHIWDFISSGFSFLDADVLFEQSKLLLPVAHLKWSLIFLNDFKLSEQQRRNFAIAGYDANQQKRLQLGKAADRIEIARQLVKQLNRSNTR